MSGKPTVPEKVHERIRGLAKSGMSKQDIADSIGRSLYTVRKALEPGFAEQEAARHRAHGAERYQARKNDPHYADYQAAYSSTAERREQVRLSMAALRAKRRGDRS
jgi:IS30 family transposase